MIEEQNKACWPLNFFEHLHDFVFAVSGCVSISSFSSWVNVAIGIASSAEGLKILAFPAGIKCTSQLSRKRRKSTINYCC